jgi:hypothetical protein
MDPVLIMDDIIEKLHLLDYQKKFCKAKNRQALSRTFFAFKLPKNDMQVQYFFEIAYWLMNLADEAPPKKGGLKNKSASKPASAKKLPVFDGFPDPESAMEKLLTDVKKFKVALPDNFSPKQLVEGHGEAVCYIINDLTNRELIRRKF